MIFVPDFSVEEFTDSRKSLAAQDLRCTLEHPSLVDLSSLSRGISDRLQESILVTLRDQP